MTNLTKMHAVRRIAGIIALFAVIGFSMTACGNGNGNGNDNGNSGNSNSPSKLTIRNLPSETDAVFCRVYDTTSYPNSLDDITCLSWESITNSPFSPIPLTKHIFGGSFTQSGNFLVILDVYRASLSGGGRDVIAIKYKVTNFTNGGATVDWNSMTTIQ